MVFMELILATNNPGKVQEIQAILAGLGLEIKSLADFGITEELPEDAETFEENALQKAGYVFEKTGKLAMADDSGLRIEALDGQPGVRTARWLGDNKTPEELIAGTLGKLAGVSMEKRGAYFKTAVGLVGPDIREVFAAKIEGRLIEEPRGEANPRLPYDSIFTPNGFDQTFAQMTEEEKNRISARGQAFRQAKDFLSNL